MTAPPIAALPDITPADAMPLGPRNIHARMLAIVAGIGWIPKGGHNDFHNYDFATATDIKDRVRDMLVSNGVMLHTTVDDAATEVHSGDKKTSIMATVRGTFSFVNVDDPVDRVIVAWVGQAIDTSDKALAKAMTSGIKYGLLNAFSIPTGADPDADSGQIPAQGAPRPTQRPATQQSRQTTRPASNQPVAGATDADDAPWPGEAPAQAPEQARGETAENPDDRCQIHHRQWTSGRYGWFCSARDASTEKGYCVAKPSAAWVARHER